MPCISISNFGYRALIRYSRNKVNDQPPSYPVLSGSEPQRFIAAKIIGAFLLAGCVLLAVVVWLVGRSVGERLLLNENDPTLLDGNSLYSFPDIGVVALLPAEPIRFYDQEIRNQNDYAYRYYAAQSERVRVLIYSWKDVRGRGFAKDSGIEKFISGYNSKKFRLTPGEITDAKFQGHPAKQLRYRLKDNQYTWDGECLFFHAGNELWHIAIEATTGGSPNTKSVIESYRLNIRIGKWLNPPMQ